MKMKKYFSLLLTLIIFAAVLPVKVLAAEYYSLKDVAEANGYEYFYYKENDTVNIRSASYILSFQKDNNMVGYKTVLGDVGTVSLNDEVKAEGDVLYVSKYDIQTKLVKYFPNFLSDSVDYSEVESTQAPVTINQSKPSNWAVNEVNDAIKNGLVTNNVIKDYQSNITREYFCELVIKLYEKISGETVTAAANVFKDTSNSEILKAYKLGIVNGVSSTEFVPNSLITRQEICTMLVRAIGAMYENIDTTDYQYHNFNDISQISSWAMDSIQFAFDNNVMQGVGDNKIAPLGNATCEQAILLVNRIYKNRADFEGKNKNSEDVIETLKRLDFDDNSEVNGVSVSFGDGSDTKGVRIKEIDSDDLIYTTTGIKGSAVNITSSKSFDTATIAFDYNPQGLGSTNVNDLAVGWYNTDLDRIEILESKVDTNNHTVSVETTHFSEYILVDSKEWYSVWQRGQTIVRETDNNGRFAENFNVQLVIDCSGSMDSGRISSARECTYDFITKLSDNDRFSVIKFEDSAQTIISSTTVSDADMQKVKNTVMSISSGGGTSFNAALNECLNTLDLSESDYNNIIVFLSDGESDVDSSLLDELKNNNVRIAAVALGGSSGTGRMKQLSDSTNGQYVYADDSSDLDDIYNAIQGSLIGVDATDADGDGLPDIVETTGMKNQYGNVIRTDPNKYDTDGDGKSDGEEMGKLIETDSLTEMDKKNGITSNVYFQMVSDPVEGHTVADKVNATSELSLSATADTMDSDGNFTLHMNLGVTSDVNEFYIKFDTDDCLDWDVERIEFWHTDFDGFIYKESLSKGNYSVDIDMKCINTALNLECGNAHKITIYALAENADKISASVVVNKNTSSSDTPSGITNNKSLSSEKLNEYKVNMAKASKKIVDTMSDKERKVTDNRKSVKGMFSVNPISGFSSLKNINLPDDVYDAFAMAIIETCDDSIIEKYETNMNKLADQIYKQIKGGLKNIYTRIEKDGVTYNVTIDVAASSGLIVGKQAVKWQGKEVWLTFENVSTEEGEEYLASYCAALAQLNTDLWKDFLAYFISDGFGLANIKAVSKSNVDKVLDATEKIIKALCDKDEANNLLNEMGATIQDELKSGNMPWSGNKFEEFVRDNVPSGDKIIEAAKQYETVKEKYDELTNMYNQAGSSDAIEQFEAEYKLLEMIVNQL